MLLRTTDWHTGYVGLPTEATELTRCCHCPSKRRGLPAWVSRLVRMKGDVCEKHKHPVRAFERLGPSPTTGTALKCTGTEPVADFWGPVLAVSQGTGAAGQLPGPWETFSRSSLGLGAWLSAAKQTARVSGTGSWVSFFSGPSYRSQCFPRDVDRFQGRPRRHRVSSHPTSDSPKGRPRNRTRGSSQHGGGVDRDGGPSSFISAARAQQTRVIGCRLSRLRRGGGQAGKSRIERLSSKVSE
jgi:hypothetical protein